MYLHQDQSHFKVKVNPEPDYKSLDFYHKVGSAHGLRLKDILASHLFIILCISSVILVFIL